MTGLVKKQVLPSPVRQVRSLKRTPAAAPMIHHMVPAVHRPDVRRILRCLLHPMEQTAQMAASTPVIILVIQTVRQALQHQTPEVAVGQPVTDVTPKPVIILINPAVRRAVPIPQALVPAGLTRFPTDAAELADVVNLVVLTLPMCLVLTDVLLNARVVLNVKLVKRQLPAALHILLAAVPAHVRVIVPVADVWVAAKELWILFVA